MNNRKLLIDESDKIFEILDELKEILNLNIQKISKKDFNQLNLDETDNYLVLTRKEKQIFPNQLVFNDFPVKLEKLLETINVQLLKQKFNKQSNISVGPYFININSREMTLNDVKLKLTEKEINTILYLSKNNKSTSIDELQKEVWSYQLKLETHTVETHIHRLRKKIKETFNDSVFIKSNKDGYQIN